MLTNLPRLLLALSLTTGLLGCSGAEVKIAFDNRATGAAQALSLTAAGRTPTVFGIRIVAAYLAEDQDGQMNNVGNVGRLWTNPVCDADLYRCGIGAGAGANRVTEYFDLALPTEEVNARLNAQGSTIAPGTYRLLRLDLAGPQAAAERDVPNMRYGMTGEGPVEVRRDNVYAVTLDPPLVLADGDTVTLSLGYDVHDSYFAGDEVDGSHPPEGTTFQDWYCSDERNGEAGVSPCLRFSGFKPAVARVER
jgi:hypothetical protein